MSHSRTCAYTVFYFHSRPRIVRSATSRPGTSLLRDFASRRGECIVLNKPPPLPFPRCALPHTWDVFSRSGTRLSCTAQPLTVTPTPASLARREGKWGPIAHPFVPRRTFRENPLPSLVPFLNRVRRRGAEDPRARPGTSESLFI